MRVVLLQGRSQARRETANPQRPRPTSHRGERERNCAGVTSGWRRGGPARGPLPFGRSCPRRKQGTARLPLTPSPYWSSAMELSDGRMGQSRRVQPTSHSMAARHWPERTRQPDQISGALPIAGKERKVAGAAVCCRGSISVRLHACLTCVSLSPGITEHHLDDQSTWSGVVFFNRRCSARCLNSSM
jgi:hypothetical protein